MKRNELPTPGPSTVAAKRVRQEAESDASELLVLAVPLGQLDRKAKELYGAKPDLRRMVSSNQSGPSTLTELSASNLAWSGFPIPPSGHCKFLEQAKKKKNVGWVWGTKLYEGGAEKDAPR